MRSLFCIACSGRRCFIGVTDPHLLREGRRTLISTSTRVNLLKRGSTSGSNSTVR